MSFCSSPRSSAFLILAALRILYERLSGASHVMEVQDRHAIPPVLHSGPNNAMMPTASRVYPANFQHQEIAEHRPIMDTDRSISDNAVPHDRPRIASGPDSRPAPVMDSLPHSVGIPSPHMQAMHSPNTRHTNTHSTHRHAQPQQQHMPHLPSAPGSGDPSSRNQPRSHVSPVMHHEHTRSHSSSRSRTRHPSGQPFYPALTAHPQQYPENMHITQHAMHSPPLAERERPRHHHDAHEFSTLHGNGRQSGFPPHHSPQMHPSDVRGSSHRLFMTVHSGI